jgi:hypothetical protein
MLEGSATAIEARGRIEVAPVGYVLDLEVRGEQRRIEGADCQRLVDAAALIVAVAHDPVGAAQVVATSVVAPDAPQAGKRQEIAKVVAPSDPVPEPGRAPPREPPVPPPPKFGGDDLEALVRPEFGIGTGVLPSLGFGVAGALGMRGRTLPWRAEMAGSYWLARTVTLGGDTTAGGRLWLGSGLLRGCYEPRRKRASFPVCAGVELGAIVGEGQGAVVRRRRDVQLWVGGLAGGGVTWAPIRRVAIVGRAELVLNLRRPGWHLEGIGNVHRVPPVGARGWVGVEIRFP